MAASLQADKHFMSNKLLVSGMNSFLLAEGGLKVDTSACIWKCQN